MNETRTNTMMDQHTDWMLRELERRISLLEHWAEKESRRGEDRHALFCGGPKCPVCLRNR